MWLHYIYLFINFINVLTSEQETERVNRFVKASLPEKFEINTTYDTQMLSQYVTSFLDMCAATSPFTVRGFGECQGRCVLDPKCVALAYTTSDRMCTHCVHSRSNGRGLKLP